MTEDYVTVPELRERGWTDAMVRDHLGEPDATKPNPRYRSAAPMRLYSASRAEAAELSPEFAARKAKAAKRRETGVDVATRKRAETIELARELAEELTASLALPRNPQRLAIAYYNDFHRSGCTCQRGGMCEKYASADDSPEFLARITVNYVRHMLTDYDSTYDQLARRVGHQDAHEALRNAVSVAIARKLAT